MFDRRAYMKEWRKTHVDWPNKPKHYNRDYSRKRREADPNYRKDYFAAYRCVNRMSSSVKARNLNQKYKLEVMSHYGKDSTAKCAWPGCEVDDLDMLTLDHIENDGKLDRVKGLFGANLQKYLVKSGFPPGFQTLCANHNLKKMIAVRKQQSENKEKRNGTTCS